MDDSEPGATVECPCCDGQGYVDGDYDQMDSECPECGGAGWTYVFENEAGVIEWEPR